MEEHMEMSWVREPKRTWAEWTAIRVLKVGPIPQHVAFIMDGNRRFARQLHRETLDGHAEGFRKLTEVLSWCRDLGITEVTVYAFSIENFKRSKAEVDGLMHLAEEKFAHLLKERNRLHEYGVRIRVIGRVDLLTPRLRTLVAKSVLATEANTTCCLNLALAYTSRDEITTAVEALREGVAEKRLLRDDLSEALLEQCLYTAGSKDPDLLIRTSGEVRLSDFLLWQTGLTHLFFSKVLWPQMSLWHMLAAVFHYQRHHHTLQHLRQEESTRRIRREEENDLDSWTSVRSEANLAEFMQKKKQRQDFFLAHVRQKREDYLVRLAEG